MKDEDIIICRCEEITKGEILQAIRDGATTVDGIKRMTRAGKGLCQGRTCRTLVEGILAAELGKMPPAEQYPSTRVHVPRCVPCRFRHCLPERGMFHETA